MLTSPITTAHFHSRVLTAIASHLSQLQSVSYGSSGTLASSDNSSPLLIPPLTPVDTPLAPSECAGQILAVASLWVDLCSPDPLIADISRQILLLEIAYAAFTGITYVLIPGPRLHNGCLQEDGLMQYARAIQEALKVGPYIQLQIWLPMIDHPDYRYEDMGDLAPFARPEYVRDAEETQSKKLDIFGTWDAWNIIRTFCKYHTRLCVGKITNLMMTIAFSPSPLMRWRQHVLDISPSDNPLAHGCSLILTTNCSFISSQTHPARINTNTVALRTHSSSHARSYVVPYESKRLSGTVKSSPGINNPLYAPPKSTLVSTVRCRSHSRSW